MSCSRFLSFYQLIGTFIERYDTSKKSKKLSCEKSQNYSFNRYNNLLVNILRSKR